MGFLDSLLNLAGLLLWFNWAFLGAVRSQELIATTPPSEPRRRGASPRLQRWHFVGILAAVLCLRAILYWQLGPAVDWTPNLTLGPIAIAFRSDVFARAWLYSWLSFGSVLGAAYVCGLLLSLVNRAAGESDTWQRLLRRHLGPIARWPWPVTLLLPWLGATGLWLALAPLLGRWGLIPPAVSWAYRLEQAATIGLSAYLVWKYLIGFVLILYLLGSYIFLGRHSFWQFVSLTGRNLLSPLHAIPLRIAKVDLAPLAGIALVLTAAEFAQRGLAALYFRLPW